MSFRDWILPGHAPGEYTMITGETPMTKKKESDYDRYRDQEYTEADATAVNFMHEVAEVVGPAPVYVTEYYVLGTSPGTKVQRWAGPFFIEEETLELIAKQPNAFVLTRVVEKE